MSKPRFFASVTGRVAVLEGNNAEHALRVLRLSRGAPVVICNGDGTEFDGVIDDVTEGRALVSLSEDGRRVEETGPSVRLFVALSKGQKLEAVIQKAVELGASGVTPFLSKRCVAGPPGRPDARLERWNKVSLEAARQCGRTTVPVVEEIQPFGEVLRHATRADCQLFCYEEATLSVKTVLDAKPFRTVSIVTGPEGGFEEDEVLLATAFGMKVVSLGPRILRCETAPLFALACVQYHCML